MNTVINRNPSSSRASSAPNSDMGNKSSVQLKNETVISNHWAVSMILLCNRYTVMCQPGWKLLQLSVYSMDKIGDMPQHCDDPVEEDNLSDSVPFTLTHWDMPPQKSTIHRTMPGLKLKLDNN